MDKRRQHAETLTTLLSARRLARPAIGEETRPPRCTQTRAECAAPTISVARALSVERKKNNTLSGEHCRRRKLGNVAALGQLRACKFVGISPYGGAWGDCHQLRLLGRAPTSLFSGCDHPTTSVTHLAPALSLVRLSSSALRSNSSRRGLVGLTTHSTTFGTKLHGTSVTNPMPAASALLHGLLPGEVPLAVRAAPGKPRRLLGEFLNVKGVLPLMPPEHLSHLLVDCQGAPARVTTVQSHADELFLRARLKLVGVSVSTVPCAPH
mmetsp:Transcript_7426/g.20368  ORF Transcript_7426/g.20368 Transcript_7426/m.20368 type:complete len:266 (+) Transcript_7426:521-1318(+)